MDRSQDTFSSLDELRQIRDEVSRTQSLEDLRDHFDRVQSLRRTYVGDFDLQIIISEVQEEIIERARRLREGQALPKDGDVQVHAAPPPHEPHLVQRREPEEHFESGDIPPDVQKLDAKTWQRATYLALFFALILFAAFFYLVQTARRLNFAQSQAGATPAAQSPTSDRKTPEKGAASTSAPPSLNPTLRLYTDLVPGSVAIDDGEPQELKDGELILDKLEPGRHSVKVIGRNGSAGFSFDVAQKIAPRIVGQPTVSNAMAVLVSSQDGKGRLVTNVEKPAVLLDGKPIAQQNTDEITLEDLGNIDHDLQVTESKDRQRFVLTYTPAPTLTVYVKSDPNAGTAIVMTGQDDVEVFINSLPYRRKTDRGQVRVPLKVGEYTIRVHKPGFIDPPPQTIAVKKAEESAVEFRLEPTPEIASLQINGALPGTMVYVDRELAAAIGNDGNANISTVKPGEHSIELRREQALPKRFDRTFRTGDVVVLSGPDVTLEKVGIEHKPAASAAPIPPSTPAPNAANQGMDIEGQQVRKGGGFVAYHVPKTSGRYTFQAQARKSGLFKRGKLQWYAGYSDPRNYILFTVDGKHVTTREVRDGKANDVAKVPFETDPNDWVQVDLSVKPNTITALAKTPSSPWTELAAVSGEGRDLTQGKVGFYIPGNDEIAVSNFRFASH
ncbi:MAG: hypothetical protein ACJ746_05915 [Bryobacteraceae bacterium]